MLRKFLTAEWRKLIMANYIVDPDIFRSYLPHKTELDSWNGKCYASLVGFMFLDTRIAGIRIPFHIDFPEVNLRFYVRFKENGEWKRGVVFLREIVPKPAISFVANTLFDENYISLRMKNAERITENNLHISYEWRYKKRWNKLAVMADRISQPLISGTAEEFITEHFWGYASVRTGITGEYQVAHPRWDIYPVNSYEIDCDFKGLYGESFGDLSSQLPESVFLAEGSEISVFKRRLV